jgi:hypothetical protein
MRNALIIVILVMVSVAAVPLSLWAAEPDHMMIDVKFFKCDKSKDLRGGIYGKGPFKRFGPPKSDCRKDEWIEITKDEFKMLATKWYGYDWSNEIPFWREP